MEFLMKSCKETHLLDRADSIRLGTLNHFRKTNDSEVGDGDEAALLTRVIVQSPAVYPNSVLKSVVPGVIDLGDNTPVLQRPFSAQGRGWKFGEMGPTHTTVKSCDYHYQTSGSDSLIFCMTTTSDRNAAPRLENGFSWKMKRSSAPRFGNKLLVEINKRLSNDPLHFIDGDEIANGVDPNRLRFVMRRAPVKYRARIVKLLDPSVQELIEVGKLLRNSDMIKCLSYSHQDEYRFCFRLVGYGRVFKFQAGLDHLDIDAANFRKFSL